MSKPRHIFLLLLAVLASCEELPLQAVGQLESDRIELVAEFSEVITAVEVKEGDSVAPGAIILRQDTARIEIRIEEAEANISRIEASSCGADERGPALRLSMRLEQTCTRHR